MSEQFPRPVADETIKFQGRLLEIVTQQMEVAPQKTVEFEWARRSPGVRLILERQDEILLTKEYRRELGTFDYRLPGGKVFDTLEAYNAFLDSAGDMESAAKDKVIGEAVEETGLIVRDAELYHTSKLGATVEWDLLYFAVSDFEEHPDGQQLEEGEDIAVVWMPKNEVRVKIMAGEMSEERSALTLLRYLASS